MQVIRYAGKKKSVTTHNIKQSTLKALKINKTHQSQFYTKRKDLRGAGAGIAF